MVQETRVQSQVKSYQTLKMVFDASLLNTQQYKVWIKDKWSTPLYLGVMAIEKGTFRSPLTTVGQFT